MSGPPAGTGGDASARIAREEIYSGRIVRLSKDTVRFPDGSVGDLELIRHAGASAILPFLDPPLDPDPRIVLLHQYRYAAGGRMYEVPAGIPSSPDEPWEACAARELEEETGYVAGDLRYLTRVYTTPGFTDEVIHLFAAAELRAGSGRHDDDEFIEVEEMPFSRALAKIEVGEIVDGKTMTTLLYAASFLREAWERSRSAPRRS